MARKFDGASVSRHTEGWYSPSTSTNVEIHGALIKLRNRSRELERNNEYAKNALRVIPNNVVGTGIIPTFRVAGKGMPDKVKARWKEWAESTKCDYDQRVNFYGLQHLVMKAVQRDGECLVIKRPAPSGYKIPYRLQVLEADYIDTSRYEQQTREGGMIWYGIEFDKNGVRKGYWLWDRHPGEFASFSRFVPADKVIHVYEVERPGQVRGVPFCHASMIRMNDLADYEFAERIRAKVAAAFTAFVTEDDSADPIGSREEYEKMEPGTIQKLYPGESITFSNPPITNGYADFTNNNLHAIAAGIGGTYANITGDVSKSNFSSSRMGWIEFSRNVQHWQFNVLVPTLCTTVFEWFLDGAILKGYFSDKIDVSVSWTPPRREMIDPYKETQAQLAAVRAGFTSQSEVIRENGNNPEEVYAEMADDAERQKKLGLFPDCNPEFDANRITPDPELLEDEKGDAKDNSADKSAKKK